MGDVLVRFAVQADLDFVSRDGFIPKEVVARKIELGEVIVAGVDGQLAGYLRLEYLWSLVPYSVPSPLRCVALIWVTPERRKQGIGRATIAFVGEFLCQDGHDVLYSVPSPLRCSSSQADEPAAQAWHRHVGFEECGIIAGINEGGIGEVFFRKRLN